MNKISSVNVKFLSTLCAYFSRLRNAWLGQLFVSLVDIWLPFNTTKPSLVRFPIALTPEWSKYNKSSEMLSTVEVSSLINGVDEEEINKYKIILEEESKKYPKLYQKVMEDYLK